jgi:hypothetical protein
MFNPNGFEKKFIPAEFGNTDPDGGNENGKKGASDKNHISGTDLCLRRSGQN